MGDNVYTRAKWISDKDHYNGDKLLATMDDILDIHGKHDDGEYAVKGTRSKVFFWTKPENIELIEPLPV